MCSTCSCTRQRTCASNPSWARPRGRQESQEIVEYNDELNHSRHKYITGTHRGDRSQRDLLLDTSLLGWDKTAKYLLMLVEMLGE